VSLRDLAEVEARNQEVEKRARNAQRDADDLAAATEQVRAVTGFEPTFLGERVYTVLVYQGDSHRPVKRHALRFLVDDVELVVRPRSSAHLAQRCPECSGPTYSELSFHNVLRDAPVEERRAFFIKRLAEQMGKDPLCGNCAARKRHECCPRCERPWVAD
jgi:hypothetical protein